MAFVRLSEFIEASQFPEKVIYDLLLTNRIPLQIDTDGYLCLDANGEATRALLSEMTRITIETVSEEEQKIAAGFESVLYDEIDRIIDEALTRLGSETRVGEE